MTARAKGLTVALNKDMREDDVQSVVLAIMQMRHVESVELNITNPDDYINRAHVRNEIKEKVFELYNSI